MYFHYFLIISPWKNEGPFIWIFRFFNWPSGSGEEDENVKSLQTNDRQTTDDRWSEKLTWAFSSGELKNGKRILSQFLCFMFKYFYSNCSYFLLYIHNQLHGNVSTLVLFYTCNWPLYSRHLQAVCKINPEKWVNMI